MDFMRCLSVLLLVHSTALLATTGVATQKKSESDRAFVERVLRNEEVIDDHLTRTDQLIHGRRVVVALTQVKVGSRNPDEVSGIRMNVFFPDQKRNYHWLGTEVCEVQGGDPILLSFFFIDLNKDGVKEIGVICRWPEHRYADCNIGTEVRFFSLPNDLRKGQIIQMVSESHERVLYREEKVSRRDESTGKPLEVYCRMPNFNNASEIRSLLRRQK